MHVSKQIRKELGLSQEDLATLLGVNRFSILRMEKGGDTLNTPALLKLAALQQHMGVERMKPIKSFSKETISYCRKLEEECFFRLSSLKRKLVSMHNRFDKCCRLRSLLDQPNASNEKPNEAWVNIQTIKMERIGLKCNETEQAVQQVLIMMCAAELTAIRKYMRQHTNRTVKTSIQNN
jgi:DNA-binding XRE family transcriptional regulator